jgi:hypothetical protein
MAKPQASPSKGCRMAKSGTELVFPDGVNRVRLRNGPLNERWIPR